MRKTVTRDNDRNYMAINRTIQDEDISLKSFPQPVTDPQAQEANIYGIIKINNITIIVSDVNALFRAIALTTSQRIRKEMKDWKNTTNCPVITDIQRTMYLTSTNYPLFSCAQVFFDTWNICWPKIKSH